MWNSNRLCVYSILSIDGEPKGASFSGELNVGTRQVRAQYNGFTEDFVIEVSPEGTRHFKLPVTARVQFHSLPDKAMLSVDGQERGQTPLLLRLPLGKHSIRMEKDQLSTDEIFSCTWATTVKPTP